jgi:hypothetical protein
MPRSTVLDIPPEEQAQMLAALRRARYGYLLALHILLLAGYRYPDRRTMGPAESALTSGRRAIEPGLERGRCEAGIAG